MIFLYRVLFPFLALLCSPYFIYRMTKRGGYGFKLYYRLGLLPILPAKKKNRRRVWIQAVSVGELSSISKILDSLLQEENIEVVLTGTTSTGLLMAANKYQDRVLANGPFPLDWWLFSGLAWARINPDLIITVDSELWPEHFYQASLRGTPALVINARLSDRTFARLSNSSLARKLLLPKGIEILTTSERQRSRWLEIGVPRDRVEVTGNLKVDALTLNDRNPFDSKTLRHQFGFPENSFVLTGISTWEGEEEMLVDVLKELRKKKIEAHLLLIPRHAERRGNVAAMLSQKVAHYHLRTQSVQAPQGTLVYLADTTGELSSLIQCSDLAFCGKTLPPHRGGQNPIEPVSLGIPLVLGPNFQNFRQTCKDLLVHQAVLTAESLQGVKSALLSLAQSQSKRIQLRQHALAWMDAQGSPSVRTLEKIHLLLSHPSK